MKLEAQTETNSISDFIASLNNGESLSILDNDGNRLLIADKCKRVYVIEKPKTVEQLEIEWHGHRSDEPCPECGAVIIAKFSGGVACTKCKYWFCY